MTVKAVPHEIALPSSAGIFQRSFPVASAVMSGAMASKADASTTTAALAGKASAESTGTYTGTLTGVTGSVTATFRYVKAGSLVVLYVPDMTGTSDSTAATITGMPAAIRPTRTQVMVGRVQDNGAFVLGGISIGADGVITLGSGILLGVFSALLAKGISAQTVCYSLI